MDAFHGYHMGNTAENVATQMADQPRRAGQVRGRLAEQGRGGPEGRPLQGRDRARSRSRPARATSIVDQDEYIRHGTTLEALAKLKPAFSKDGVGDGRQRVGHQRRRRRARADDGRGSRRSAASRRSPASPPGRRPASIRPSWASGPIPASRKALEKAGWKVKDLDLVEANEAFAAQALAVNKDMGWDPAIVNVNGGAIAIGHPIGASGARVLDDAAARDAAPRRQEGPRDAVHRRRHGHRA